MISVTLSFGSWNGENIFEFKSFISVFSCQHICHSEFDQSKEYKHEARGHPDIYSFCIGHVRQRRVHTGTLRCHCEHRKDTQWDTSRNSVYVKPEGYPGQHDDKDTWNVHLDEIIADIPGQSKLHN